MAPKVARKVDGAALPSCTASTCPRAARLENVMTENGFLGETVTALRAALEETQRACLEKQSQMDEIMMELDAMRVGFDEAKADIVRVEAVRKELAAAQAQCRSLRQDKGELLDHSWKALEQLSETRARNDRLEALVSTMRDELDENHLETRLRASKLVLEKVNQVRQHRGDDGDEAEALVNEIEVIEAQAMAGERLERELHQEQARSDLLRDRLQESQAMESNARKIAAEATSRESHWIRQLQHEMQQNALRADLIP